MFSARDLLISGLRNAHAMERQAQELMERQISRTEDYPEVRVRLQRHLDETRSQLGRLDRCLESCGEGPSTIKDATMALTGNLAAMGHAMAADEILKNTFANNAFEHYEIAAYKSLIALAEQADQAMVAELKQSLSEEEDMAAWVDANVRPITLAYMRREAGAGAA